MKYAVYSVIALAVSVFCGTVLMKTIMKEKKSGKGKRILLAAGLSVLIFTTGFLVYLLPYQKAEGTPVLMLEGKAEVKEERHGKTSDIACKAPEKSDTAIIFYPGAKVEETAYAPLLHQLAENDMDVCLVKMPLRFAFLGINKAEPIIQKGGYVHYYMGGHSLGGAMAAEYAADHSDMVEGLIHLASYSTKELDESMMEMVIYGTEDRIVNKKNIEAGRRMAPDRYYEYTIEGGNHAQFGNYGDQAGDGPASISASEQQSEAIRMITDTIK